MSAADRAVTTIREPRQLHDDEAERLAYWGIGCECSCVCLEPATHYLMMPSQVGGDTYLCRDCFEDCRCD